MNMWYSSCDKLTPSLSLSLSVCPTLSFPLSLSPSLSTSLSLSLSLSPPPSLSQYHMVTAHSTMGDHTFAADPTNWPLMGKSLPYWLDETNNAQINLLGNPLLWWAGTAAIMAFTALLVFYLMRRRRRVFDLAHSE